MRVLAYSHSGNVAGLPKFFSYLPFHNLRCHFGFLHIIPINQNSLLVFNALANVAESEKRDLIKELETMKQLKPHPYVIKLLGCVTESGMLWLCGSDFSVHNFLWIYFATLSSYLFIFLNSILNAPGFNDCLRPNICH